MQSQNLVRESSRPRIVIAASEHARLTELAEKAMKSGSPVAEFLAEELSRAHIVPDDACSPHVVRMGSQVTYSDDVARRVHKITVVYPWDADIDKNRVSVLTPVGAALIGLSPAQSIQWPNPDGRMGSLTVLEVKAGGESSG
ncbi:MAG TPA: nucleoside diphosphate kinase regulator [Steroidobacteraceae bacterium]